MDEYIDILNEQGKVSGNVCLKSEAHKNGLFHQSVHIWIVDFNNNVLIQKELLIKMYFPTYGMSQLQAIFLLENYLFALLLEKLKKKLVYQ